MITLHSRRIPVVGLLVAAAFSVRAGYGAPAWYGANGGFVSNLGDGSLTVPDFYQHQDWVSSGAAATNPMNGWETVSGATGGAGGGWCNYTAYADIFYDFYARGITSIYPNAAVNPITNPYNALYGATNSAANVVQSDIYQIRGAMGPTTAKNVQIYLTAQNTGLLSNSITVGDGTGGTTIGMVYYNDPATGALKPLNMSTFTYTNLMLKHFTANIVYTLLVGTASTATNANGQGIWWGSSFHNVAVAGVNTANSSVYVADPDSNLGPGPTFAGWPFQNTNFPAAAPFSLTSPAGSPRPVPAAPNVNTPTSYNTYYDNFQFGQIPLPPGQAGPPAPLPANAVGSFDAPQYNGSVVSKINPVFPNPIQNLLKNIRLASNSLPAVQTTLTITLPTGADPIDGICIEPTSTLLNPSTDPSFFSASIPSDSSSLWSTGTVLTTDPLGNAITYGSVEFNLLSGNPLSAGEDAQINLGTLADFSGTGYNILFHFLDDPSSLWLPSMEGGSLFNPSDTASDQLIAAPEPAALALLALALPTLLCRRSNRRRAL